MKSQGIAKGITVTFVHKWAQMQDTHRGRQVRDQKARFNTDNQSHKSQIPSNRKGGQGKYQNSTKK